MYATVWPGTGALTAVGCNNLNWTYDPGIDQVATVFANLCGHNIVVDSRGDLHIVFTKAVTIGATTYNTVFHSYSSDGGKSWTAEEIDDSFVARQEYAQIVIDKNDTLHFVWGEALKYINYRNKDINGNWSAVETINEVEAQNTWCPALSVAPDGLTVGCVWASPRCFLAVPPALGDINETLYYSERSAVGIWSANEYPFTLGSPLPLCAVFQFVRIALEFDQNSKAHVVALAFDGNDHVQYMNNVTGWALIATLSGDPASGISNIVCDLNGTLHLIIGFGNDLHYYTGVGGVWSNVEVVTGTYLESGMIQVSSTGLVYIYYVNTSHEGVYRIIYTDGTVGVENVWYSVAGRAVKGISVLWSHYPLSNGQYSQLSKQGNCYAFVEHAHDDYSECRIMFTADDSSVVGDAIGVGSSLAITQRFRGVLNSVAIGSRNIMGPNIR